MASEAAAEAAAPTPGAGCDEEPQEVGSVGVASTITSCWPPSRLSWPRCRAKPAGADAGGWPCGGRDHRGLDGYPAGRDREGSPTVARSASDPAERVISRTTRGGDRAACAHRACRVGRSNRPRGCSCSWGPAGVGKTETALALANILYGGERNLITINVTSTRRRGVSSLKGSPGCVGYGEGGVLSRGGASQALQRGVAGRGGEAHPRRAGDVLPGV